jgi:hypothetical protein
VTRLEIENKKLKDDAQSTPGENLAVCACVLDLGFYLYGLFEENDLLLLHEWQAQQLSACWPLQAPHRYLPFFPHGVLVHPREGQVRRKQGGEVRRVQRSAMPVALPSLHETQSLNGFLKGGKQENQGVF